MAITIDVGQTRIGTVISIPDGSTFHGLQIVSSAPTIVSVGVDDAGHVHAIGVSAGNASIFIAGLNALNQNISTVQQDFICSNPNPPAISLEVTWS